MMWLVVSKEEVFWAGEGGLSTHAWGRTLHSLPWGIHCCVGFIPTKQIHQVPDSSFLDNQTTPYLVNWWRWMTNTVNSPTPVNADVLVGLLRKERHITPGLSWGRPITGVKLVATSKVWLCYAWVVWMQWLMRPWLKVSFSSATRKGTDLLDCTRWFYGECQKCLSAMAINKQALSEAFSLGRRIPFR